MSLLLLFKNNMDVPTISILKKIQGEELLTQKSGLSTSRHIVSNKDLLTHQTITFHLNRIVEPE